MNYVTVDAHKIGEFPYWFHQIWTITLQVYIAKFIVYYSVGLATVVALVVITLTVLGNSPLAKLQLKYQNSPIRNVPDVIGAFIDANVSLSRIVKFLDAPELQNKHIRQNHVCELKESILIKSTGISWDNDPLKSTLRNINMDVKHGEKVAICGEVGSGKSTLISTILGEVPYINGIGRNSSTYLPKALFNNKKF